MKMRKYTQEEIDDLLDNFDITNPIHRQQFLDIVLISTIDLITPSQYTLNTRRLHNLSNDIIKYLSDNKRIEELSEEEEEHIDPNYQIRGYYSLASLLVDINKEQGIDAGDFERNIWRLAYVFKSTQYAEEMAIQGKEVARPIDLVENFKEDDTENFNATYVRLATHYIDSQALIGYLRVVQDKTEVADIQRFIDKLELDLDLVDILQEEAEMTEGYILDYLKRKVNAEELSAPTREELEEKTNKLIDELFERYKPLLHVPNLKRMKLKDSTYLKMRDRYKDLTVKELIERKNEIQNDFKDVLFNDYAER